MDTTWMQLMFIIPLGWLWGLLFKTNAEIRQLKSEVYTKAETTEMIKLNLAPLEVKLDQMNKQLSHITVLLEKRDGNKR